MNRLPVLKVVIAGDGTVGKTSLIRRYCEGKFEATRVQTIGVDFQTQTVDLPDIIVKLSIWDMAGQDRFAVMRAGFYRGSRASALVFDVTQEASFNNLERWRGEILGTVKEQPFLVVGNKVDLGRRVLLDDANAFAASIGAQYIETSALTGEGVPGLFEILAESAFRG